MIEILLLLLVVQSFAGLVISALLNRNALKAAIGQLRAERAAKRALALEAK